MFVLASQHRVKDHLTADRSQDHVVDFVFTDVVELVFDLVFVTHVAVQNVVARAPQVLLLDMERGNCLCVRRVQLEKFLAFLGDALDALSDGVENAELILASDGNDDAHDLLVVRLRLRLALEDVLDLSLFDFPDLQVLLGTYDELLKLPLRLQR